MSETTVYDLVGGAVQALRWSAAQFAVADHDLEPLMSPRSTAFDITELAIPATLDSPGAADFAATVDVRNAVEAAALGTRELAPSVEILLANWNDPYDPKRLFVARVDGRIVARGLLGLPMEEGSVVAWCIAEVLPEFQGRGIGTALMEVVEAEAAKAGRTTLQSFAAHAPGEGERLPSPTGFGAVPRDNREVRFLLDRGYALEQVDRYSRFELDGTEERIGEFRADSEASAGSDYRYIEWTGDTPEQYLTAMAELSARMATDAPSADMDIDEEVWDAARVRDRDARLRAGGLTQVWAVAEHIPSGELVAMSGLEVSDNLDMAVNQADTLVRADHRGHRLGMLVKAGNLQQLRRVFPDRGVVATFNAEENRPMLQVNEDLGFVPAGYYGNWKKLVSQ